MSAERGLPRDGGPALPRTYLDRLLLWQALDDAAGSTVTEVVGPAGSGKTLGVAGWAARQVRRAAEPPARWWTVTPTLTVHGLRELLDEPEAERSRPAGSVPHRIILDNAERLSRACVAELESVLDAPPDRLRVVLLTRWDLAIRRLAPMLLGTMSVVRGDVLRLTDDEARAIVALHVHGCPPGLVDAVVAQAQGWCAAVVLAARAAARRVREPGAHDASFSRASDLVGQEAFAGLPARARHVLLTICHEERVTGRAAVHLSQDPAAVEVMETLEETGLLVHRQAARPGDRTAERAFRVHPILVHVARRRLATGGAEAQRARGAVARAAASDVACGDIGTGLRRTYDAAGAEAAVAVLARHGVTAVVRGEGATVGDLVRRCAGAVDAEPRSWLAAAVDRWLVGDVEAAARWSGRLVAADSGGAAVEGLAAGDVAIAHLLRAQLGAEDPLAAAASVAAGFPGGPQADEAHHALLADLLGASRTWTGELDTAERDLAGAAMSARTHGYRALEQDALGRLALTELLRGRPEGAAGLAGAASRDASPAGPVVVAVTDAAWARTDPWQHAADPPADTPPAGLDLVATYVAHVTAAQRLVIQGHATRAEASLGVPAALPALPRHLAVDLQVRRGLVAVASDDVDALVEAVAVTGAWEAEPERGLLEAFLAICRSDPGGAETLLRGVAGAQESPFVGVLAAVTLGQLVATRGDRAAGRALVAQALERAQHRRDAVPFVGWVGHVVPVHILVGEVTGSSGSSTWASRLARSAKAHGSVATRVAHRTPTGRERATQETGSASPTLTVREQEVLTQLARGATYADIAATLFVSPNTVKTHVTSLYAKLGARRRSQALASARTFDLV